MLRSSWHKAVTLSLLLHCLLLLGIGWKATVDTLAPKEEQNIEMELAPDTYKMDVVSSVVSEATVAESVSEEKTPIDSNKETQEQQARRENKGDVSSANNRSAAQVSGKDVQLTNYSKEQLEVALAKYNLLLALDSPLAIIYNDRGKIYYDKGEFDKAFADFDQALVLDTHFSSAHIGRGFIYIKRNRWDLALKDFDQAITTSPKNALAYYGRAQCFINNNNKQKAIDDFRHFIQYAPPENKKLTQMAQQMLSELGE